MLVCLCDIFITSTSEQCTEYDRSEQGTCDGARQINHELQEGGWTYPTPARDAHISSANRALSPIHDHVTQHHGKESILRFAV